MAYEIHYAAEAVADLRAFRKFDAKRIKRMIKPFWSDYRLRVEEFRIYYDVEKNRSG